jgi:hypothetical protein
MMKVVEGRGKRMGRKGKKNLLLISWAPKIRKSNRKNTDLPTESGTTVSLSQDWTL